MTDQKTVTTSEAEQLLTEAQGLLKYIESREWVLGKLNAEGPVKPADHNRPIDQLAGQYSNLVPLVQPLEDVYDRMAYDGPRIEAEAAMWQRAADKINDVVGQLKQSVPTDSWTGFSAISYMIRAAGLGYLLESLAVVCVAKSNGGRALGAVAADARQQVGDRLNELVQRLITDANVQTAAGSAPSPEFMKQAAELVKSYSAPIRELEQDLVGSANQLFTNLDYSGGIGNAKTADVEDTLVLLSMMSGPGGLRGKAGSPGEFRRKVNDAERMRRKQIDQFSARDPSGRVHRKETGPVPEHVPEHWPADRMEEMREEMPHDLAQRRANSRDPKFDPRQNLNNPDADLEKMYRQQLSHARETAARERLLRRISKKLSGS